MEIRAFASLLWRWVWFIGLVALLSGILAFVISTRLTPTYESKVTVTVARRSAADSEYVGVNERPTATYIELLRKRPVLDAVIARLQLNTDAATLERQLRISVPRNTSLIVLTVKDSDPERAASIANEIVNLVSQRGRELLGNDVTLGRYSLFVVDPARAATEPVSPNIPLNVAVLSVVGALLAVGVIVLREYLDDRIRSPDEIAYLVGAKTMATIPPQPALQVRGKPLVIRDSFAPAAESYRMLRAYIDHVAASRPVQTLLVTSATSAEGTSTTIANLAVVLAQVGRRVVLVDADLRNPSLHTIFQQPNERGLTTALQSDVTHLKDHFVSTGIANLSLLTSGPLPSNPAEVIGSPQMVALIERLKAEADIILLDSPALLSVVDSIDLARLCDACVLVVRSGVLRAGVLVNAYDRLRQFGIEPLGVVLNGCKTVPVSAVRRTQPVRASHTVGDHASAVSDREYHSNDGSPSVTEQRPDTRLAVSRSIPSSQDIPTRG